MEKLQNETGKFNFLSTQFAISLLLFFGVAALVYLFYILLQPKFKASDSDRLARRALRKKEKKKPQDKEFSGEGFSASQLRGSMPRLVPTQTPAANKKAREDLMRLISDLKSVRKEEFFQSLPNEDVSEEEFSSSEIINALVGTLISEVEVKGEDSEKLSKLSLDASLLFDEEEAESFAKEFEQKT
ncbi:MAG: hypothetical protein EA369_03760 [Bradymonadales bacterium]|nr:MAG: hypothetical protein EA369_03760 [Bradymonadales bacterium]